MSSAMGLQQLVKLLQEPLSVGLRNPEAALDHVVEGKVVQSAVSIPPVRRLYDDDVARGKALVQVSEGQAVDLAVVRAGSVVVCGVLDLASASQASRQVGWGGAQETAGHALLREDPETLPDLLHCVPALNLSDGDPRQQLLQGLQRDPPQSLEVVKIVQALDKRVQSVLALKAAI
eukprot:CAMPEP_0179199512 /NCGR_PEP_ID=MMETSP0796-20121207/99262_1 /TAXON_ID=73915 /ORGANISM="Pyrodinium bahamense, Strain pbaha01" /LENGTH=175 /DNA_ID=CAMNT_0020904013 /DNA_START=11 /DNA_END=538 /DNA_ORIENTATION=+